MSDNRKFFDIKRPSQKSPTPRVVKVPLNIPYIPIGKPIEFARSRSRINFRIPIVASAAVFLLVLGIFGFNVMQFKQQANNTAPFIYEQFRQGASALLNFELGEAKESFQKVSEELAALNSQAPLKTVPSILENLFKLSRSAANLSSALGELKENGLSLLINKKGAFLIEYFKNIKNHFMEINRLSDLLKSQASSVGYKIDDDFSSVNEKLSESDKFLAGVINWLETPKKQRLLIFFQNPSEIRPAGGFIGSYGHATLFQGNLLDLEVRDIYDPDGQLDLKVVPPKPLQGITDKWGARDANWFFDFPASARKVIDFLEASKIYSEQGIKFSGAVAVNVNVLKDILDVVGPIDLADYQMTITGENFLREVQREVEAGEDKAKGEPKKILKVLSPILFEKLASLNDIQKSSLVEKLTGRFNQKDIMVYFKDKTIQDYLKNLGVAGEVMELPSGFTGEYLAVVNSNIAGGKSDAFVSQNIKFKSQIDRLGQIKNHLTVERAHSGENEKEWWYRSTNRNYMQIFVTPGSEFIKMTGDTKKVIKPLIDYADKNYSNDSLLKNLEMNGALVFGKTVFPAWLDLKAGTSKKLELEYSSPGRINLAGGSYQFVFEKQSGVNTGLEVSVEAPEGYRWKENQSRIFNYSGQDLLRRTVLNLTLEADPQ